MTRDDRELIREWTTDDGWTLRAYRVPDYDPDLSHLGAYMPSPVADEKKTMPHGICELSMSYHKVPAVHTRQGDLFDRHDSIYYRPQRGCEESWEADERRLRDYYLEQWSMIGVEVEALRAGVVLGSASLWGIESDAGESDMREIEEQVAGDALTEAKGKLAELVAGAESMPPTVKAESAAVLTWCCDPRHAYPCPHSGGEFASRPCLGCECDCDPSYAFTGSRADAEARLLANGGGQ